MKEKSNYNHISTEDILKILEVYNNNFGINDGGFTPDLETHSIVIKMWLDEISKENDSKQYVETDLTEKLVDDSVEFGKNVMIKKISNYLIKNLPMTPDDKENFVEEMIKNIK